MKRSSLKCFTLIELLVVVAIISILAALLLPSLNRAKEQTLQIRCINNLRQLATGLQLYVTDNGEFLPCPQAPGAVCYDYGGWIPQIRPYVVTGTNALSSSSVFYCPVKATGTAAGTAKKFMYAMNHDLRCNVSGTRPDKKISEVVDQSRAMAFIENGMYEDVVHMGLLQYGLYGHPTSPTTAGPAHGGKGLGIVYVDGHAEFWRRVPPYSEYQTDSTLPWTHKSFWGMKPPGLNSEGSRGTEIAPYNP